MEDLEPICEAEQTSFCVELMKRLNMQRGQGYLCNITLVAKEGNEFKAHRNVLSAASPFFATLLQSEMKEKEEGVIRFEEISASIMEDVLGFIYTGNVEIDDEQNAKDLIIAADYLLLVCLKTVAGRFLENQLTISNCISTFYFAEKFRCEDLVASSTKFILENFPSVAESEGFLDLEAEQVGSWISNDEICVAAEEDVLKIIEKWIEQNKRDRKAKFEELFGHVRLVFVSRDFLLVDVVTNDLVRENVSCLKNVSDAIALVSFESEDVLAQSPRRRLGTHTIVACGGERTLCYLPQTDKWKLLSYDRGKDKGCFTQMINFRDQLFTFGVNDSTERYDPVLDSWSSLKRMRLSSFSTQVAVVRGQIYAFTVDRRDTKSTIERYNMGSLSWETILKSHEACRENSCLVSAGNCLYVMGGESSQQLGNYVAKAERFDTVQNKWQQIADMQEARGRAFGVATEGKIFVAGGRSSSSSWANNLKTCEVYSISTNEWEFIGSLNAPRLRGSMVFVNGTLYVLGGQSPFSSSEYSVESYDPTANVWNLKTSIKSESFGDKQPTFKACALKLSKGVLEKLRVVR